MRRANTASSLGPSKGPSMTSHQAVSGKLESPPPSLLSSLRSTVVVTAFSLVLLAAFRNTLTWHLQRFWGASGDFWQTQWNRLLDNYGEDERMFWVVGTTAITMAVFWGLGSIYTILDLTNKPAAMRRYKIQPGTNEPLDPTKLVKVVAQVLFNQIVVGVPVTYFSYFGLKWRGMPDIRELPTFHWVLFELACFILIEEIGFYYTHRLMHHRLLYKYIHKQHHEWTAPIAITAVYCHPIEHLISNLMPPVLGLLVMGSHIATAWLWFALAFVSTLNDHSGYHLPFLTSPEFHDFHHLKFTQCFGALGLLDRLHGTDTMFRNSNQYSRHLTMLNLTPAREAYPDPDKKMAGKK